MNDEGLKTWRKSPEFYNRLVQIYSPRLKRDKDSPIFIPLADAYRHLGKTGEATAILIEGLRHHPDNRAAKIMMAEIHYNHGAVAECRQLLEQVVARWPDAYGAVSLLCLVYERGDEAELAQPISRALLDYYPDSAKVRKLSNRYAPGTGPVVDEPADAASIKTEPEPASTKSPTQKFNSILARIAALKSRHTGG